MSKEREAFEAWAKKEIPIASARQEREFNFAHKGWQACAAHYQPLLEAKDAELLTCKALLEQAREGFENIVMHISEMENGAVTNQDGWFLRLSKQTLAAINAATGKGE